MGEEEKEKKVVTRKELEKLKEEIAQKGKEIEQLKKTIEELRAQIQGREENTELGKIFEDVSELLDVGFSIFGASSNIEGEKSRGKGLLGLINDMVALTEKSETYQKRINLGKIGAIDLHVSSRPIRRNYTPNPTGHLSKPKKNTLRTFSQVLPTADSISEREPIVDIFEEADQIRVIAELRGVEENEIKLGLDDNSVTISTSDGKYCKKVELPTYVEKNTIETNYKNGILEVKLKKAKK
jgi:HSP20 family molecular chaperone IbpA